MVDPLKLQYLNTPTTITHASRTMGSLKQHLVEIYLQASQAISFEVRNDPPIRLVIGQQIFVDMGQQKLLTIQICHRQFCCLYTRKTSILLLFGRERSKMDSFFAYQVILAACLVVRQAYMDHVAPIVYPWWYAIKIWLWPPVPHQHPMQDDYWLNGPDEQDWGEEWNGED